jgi:hypothetical protein
MSTETLSPKVANTSNSPAQFSTKSIDFGITQARIDELSDQYKGLTINGPDDKDGAKIVYDARQVIKRARVGVDKKRKELNADALAYQRQVNSVASALTENLGRIETHLELEEKAYNDERERIAHEKQMLLHQRLERRRNELRAFGFGWNEVSETYEFQQGDVLVSILFDDVKEFSDEEYQPTYDLAKKTFDNEQVRLAEVQRIAEQEAARIEADRIAEEQRLATVRAEQEAEAKRLQDIADKQEAERVRLQQERDDLVALQRQSVLTARSGQLAGVGFTFNGRTYNLLTVYRLTADEVVDMAQTDFDTLLSEARVKINEAQEAEAERIRQAERDKIAQAAADKAEIDWKAKEKAEKKRRLAPDKDKLIQFADLLAGIEKPVLKSDEAKAILNVEYTNLTSIVSQLRHQAETL